MAIVIPDGFRIVKFEEMTLSIVINMNHREGTIGHLSLFANRQCLNNSFNTVLHVGTSGSHGAEYLASQSGEDVGFHSAAQPIGQNESRPTFVDAHLNIVAA